MELKNKRFKIFDEYWTIKFVDKIEKKNAQEGEFTFGLTNSINHTIQIATLDCDGKKFSDSEMSLTLTHELVHAILDSGQYIDCSNDEPLVEWLAKCIQSLIKQKVL